MVLNPDNLRQIHFRPLGHDLVQQRFRVFIAAHLGGSRPVLDLGTVSDLPAEAMLLQHQGILSVPLRVKRRRHTCRTSADHNNVCHLAPIL